MKQRKCRICGGEPIISLWDGWIIQCKQCDFELRKEFNTETEALKEWNRIMHNYTKEQILTGDPMMVMSTTFK